MLEEIKLIRNKPIISNVYGFENYHGTDFKTLRKLAKQIAKEKQYDYFKNEHESFEEILIHAYAIGYLKENINYMISLIKDFVKYVTNWAINDALCQNMLFARKYQKEVFNYLLTLIDSSNEWEKRIVEVTLLSHYLNETYIDKVIEVAHKLVPNTYMSKMGYAWLLATMMAKFPTKTMEFMQKTTIDSWTYNKAIQKMIESFRVSTEDKILLKSMKRK